VIPNGVYDQVVPLRAFGEILLGVVDDVICSRIECQILR